MCSEVDEPRYVGCHAGAEDEHDFVVFSVFIHVPLCHGPVMNEVRERKIEEQH